MPFEDDSSTEYGDPQAGLVHKLVTSIDHLLKLKRVLSARECILEPSSVLAECELSYYEVTLFKRNSCYLFCWLIDQGLLNISALTLLIVSFFPTYI